MKILAPSKTEELTNSDPKPAARESGRPDLAGKDYDAQVAALSPVQCKGVPDSSQVRAHAAAGIQSGASPLPHMDAIQRSFGRHSVSDVQAHVGGPAAAATAQMGATAYAMDNHVAFGESPSLHTAAHEAAHVVQQQGGVSLKGGVGQSGDAYEQHADAVADAVVAGKSAEGMLDRYRGDGAKSSAGGAVQRKGGATGGKTDDVVAKGLEIFADGAEAEWRWIPTTLGLGEEERFTVHFADPDVQRVKWHIFGEWLGLTGPSFPNPMLDSTRGKVPGWVAALRTKALTFRSTPLTATSKPYAQTDPDHHSVAEGDPALVTIAKGLCDSVQDQTAAQKFREGLVRKADGNVGKKLMTDKVFQERSAAKPGYTSCIDTLTDHLGAGASNAGGVAPGFTGPNDYEEINPKVHGNPSPGTKQLGGAWVGLWEGKTYDAEKGKTVRPKPGDMIIQTAADKHMVSGRQFYPGMFKHIATFRSGGAMKPDGTEEWVTVDGGNEAAGQGKAAPVQERIATFDSKAGTVKKGGETRRLHGWIDVEVMYEDANKPKGGAKTP